MGNIQCCACIDSGTVGFVERCGARPGAAQQRGSVAGRAAGAGRPATAGHRGGPTAPPHPGPPARRPPPPPPPGSFKRVAHPGFNCINPCLWCGEAVEGGA
jgi:hypothetical protein